MLKKVVAILWVVFAFVVGVAILLGIREQKLNEDKTGEVNSSSTSPEETNTVAESGIPISTLEQEESFPTEETNAETENGVPNSVPEKEETHQSSETVETEATYMESTIPDFTQGEQTENEKPDENQKYEDNMEASKDSNELPEQEI